MRGMDQPIDGRPSKPRVSRDTALLIAIALGKLALNMAFHGRYGYFRDELYYIACSDHLAWGYVDQPPFSILILALTRFVLGDSLYAIRFPAALAGAAVVVLAGLIARRLGGGRFAQVSAALAAAASPAILGNGARTFSMNAFDLLFWAWGAYLVLIILREDRPRLWLLFGVVAGLGLLNKYSMLFLGFGLVAGLVLTSHRRQLLKPWIWLGGLVALLIVLPHLVWEQANGWPSLEFMRNASQHKNVHLSILEFFSGQVLQVGFAQAPIWLLGLAYFLFHREGKLLRAFGWMYPAVFALMVANGAKAYYLTPIYVPFIGAGAAWIAALTEGARRRWARPAVVSLLLLVSLIPLPFAVPCLRVDDFVRYSRALGQTPKAEERHALADLPQYYADEFGWEAMVETVAGVWQRLTPEEREHAVIYVRNYGEAAAIDFFGRRYGLPRATCAHNNYWLWGPGDAQMTAAIVFANGGDSVEEALADLRGPTRFASAELAATTACTHCMPFENGRLIFLCRKPAFTFREIWAEERFFY